MSTGSGRAFGVAGWGVAAALAALYLLARYDVTIRARTPFPGPPGGVISAGVAPEPPGPPSAGAQAEPEIERAYRKLAAEARAASGSGRLAVDVRLEAAERDFPSDYRFTYERAALAVYGRAAHHEAFHHLRRAAEKAIATERSDAMLARLERDGAPGGGLRKLAVGHAEWTALREALTRRDPDPLWREHAARRPHGHHDGGERGPHGADAAGPEHRAPEPAPPRDEVAWLLESGKPCRALVALRAALERPDTDARYQAVRERCVRGLSLQRH